MPCRPMFCSVCDTGRVCVSVRRVVGSTRMDGSSLQRVAHILYPFNTIQCQLDEMCRAKYRHLSTTQTHTHQHTSTLHLSTTPTFNIVQPPSSVIEQTHTETHRCTQTTHNNRQTQTDTHGQPNTHACSDTQQKWKIKIDDAPGTL